MIPTALADLRRRLEEGAKEERLAGESPLVLEMYATPRRLVAYSPAIPDRQPPREKVIQGPPKRIAFDNEGKPTAAAVQFAAKNGVRVEKLETVSTAKGAYLVCRRKQRGRQAIDVLQELIPKVVLGIYFPRTMYWEGKAGPHFIRPIRWL